ncbi:MAG TPA: GntR family transcriptional regulator [Thermoanaerobaculaceae bacterium]|nr:GntR family transcriptional regulator [Thermoanaerobaculaceae bacterium]
MSSMIEIDPTDAAPIWRQIEERVRRLVFAGTLAPGTSVPSVRELARTLRINPATVAKAYQRLTDSGVLQVRRGEGTFVVDAPPPLAAAERERALRDGAHRYAATALAIGVSPTEATEELHAAWASLTSVQEVNP